MYDGFRVDDEIGSSVRYMQLILNRLFDKDNDPVCSEGKSMMCGQICRTLRPSSWQPLILPHHHHTSTRVLTTNLKFNQSTSGSTI